MYRCVIADDEPLDLEGLRRLIDWKSLGMEVVCAAGNGFAVLDFLRRESADILVTDIKMPILSGLEAARQAVRLHPGIKLLFISGYEDFHYAKHAIDLNASGYLLKPVDNDELYEQLRKLRDQLDQERTRRSIERSLPLIQGELLTRWLEGGGRPEDWETIAEAASRGGHAEWNRAALVEIDDLGWKLNPYPPEQRDEIIGSIKEFIFEWCRANRCHPVQVDRRRYALLCREEGGADLAERLRDLVEAARGKFPVTLTAAAGGIAAAPEELPASYRAAADALSLKMFVGKGRVIAAEKRNRQLVSEVRNMDDVLNELFDAMNKYELVRIDDNLQLLFQSARAMNEKLQVHHFSMHLIAKLEQYLSSIGENLYGLLGIELSNLDVLYRFETIADIQSWMRRRLFEISEKLRDKASSRNGRLILEIKKYVEEHIGEAFTLKDVANAFSFSPNYLGHLFKEECGENFSDYVIRVRMEKARELLRDPRKKIYEVADETGYSNFTVFYRQFRKRFGVSPGDFRKRG